MPASLSSLFFLQSEPDVLATFSTRRGGVSQPPFAELNVGFHVGDELTAVQTNRQLISEAHGLNVNHLTAGQQTHSVTIQTITAANRGRGALTWDSAFADTDGLVTAVPDIPLLVVVADCAAVYVYDPVHHVIGLGHAGWRGTLKGMVFHLLNTMNDQFGTLTNQVKVAIGPCLGVECYPVGEELLVAFREQWGPSADQFFVSDAQDQLHLDLRRALTWQLTQLGVRPQALEVSPDCTSCHLDRFYSHRAEHGRTGRMAAILMLQPRPE